MKKRGFALSALGWIIIALVSLVVFIIIIGVLSGKWDQWFLKIKDVVRFGR